jgi:hypothetical protein
MMSIAQGVQHALHRVIGLPVIVNDDAGDIRQETAAPGTDAIEGQQRGGRHVQPLRLAAAECGLKPDHRIAAADSASAGNPERALKHPISLNNQEWSRKPASKRPRRP